MFSVKFCLNKNRNFYFFHLFVIKYSKKLKNIKFKILLKIEIFEKISSICDSSALIIIIGNNFRTEPRIDN